MSTVVPRLDRPTRRRSAAKMRFDPSPYRRLFRVLTFLRGGSPESLDALFFARAFPQQSTRSNDRALARLVHEGFLARLRLPYGRILYHLTRRSLGELASTADANAVRVPDTLRRPPTMEVGGFLWLQSTLRAVLVRRGFTLGRGREAVQRLRRYLLDTDPHLPAQVAAALRADPTLAPPPAHGATPVDPMEEVECLPLDIGWRTVNGRREVIALFVEHPARGLTAQLEALPFRHRGAPRVPIVWRSTDPDSRYDKAKGQWLVKGPRHQLLEREFVGLLSPALVGAAHEPVLLADTTLPAEVRSDLQLHPMRSSARPPAWERARLWNGRGPQRVHDKPEHKPDERQAERHEDRGGGRRR